MVKKHPIDAEIKRVAGNMRLEGMHVSKGQSAIARDVRSGRISRKEAVAKALKYARSA